MDEKELKNEQLYLEKVQALVQSEIDQLDINIKDLDKKIREALKDIADSRTEIDYDELKQRMRDEVNTPDYFMAESTKTKRMFERILPKPFFAKLKVDELDGTVSDYYIGLKNIFASSYDLAVIDWRTPVASLLYFSSLGPSSYQAPAGKVDVNLLLKRQFRLAPNKILSYVDTDTKIDDGILQEILSKTTSSHMSNIVQTIQQEQNQIIRKPANETVIINGIAGSGKTSIAMHRISYILYVNKGKIKSENVLVISPNQLFSTYISDVLPELGEDNVAASPITQVLSDAKLMPAKFGDRLSMVDSQFLDEERRKEIDRKYSVAFFDETNAFLENLDLIPYIKQAFADCDYEMPNCEISKMRKVLNDTIFDRAEYYITTLLQNAFPLTPEKALRKVRAKILIKLKKILTTKKVMDALYQEKGLHYAEEGFGYEDAPIYAYINAELNGSTPNYYIKHIFVDEMQDYDPFSIALIKKLYPESVMTLAGDYNQNILSGQSNLELLNRLFPEVKVDNLDVSYRSTNEIINFAQSVVNKKAETRLVRHGDAPVVKKCKNNDNFLTLVKEVVDAHPEEKIAIITKSFSEAYAISKLLPDFDFVKDEKDDGLLTSNRIITTIYLSKGLEYDRVILPNVDSNNYVSPLDRQNLYVASTRALHGLYVTYSTEPSRFLPVEASTNSNVKADTSKKKEEIAPENLVDSSSSKLV